MWWAAALLLAVPATGASDPPSSVRVAVRLRETETTAGRPGSVEVFLRRAAATGTASEERALRIKPEEPVTVEIEPGLWTAAAKASGFWSPEASLMVGQGPTETLFLDLWPAGSIRGMLALPGRDPTPTRLWADFQRSAERVSGLPPGQVQCSIRNRQFDCELPAGDLDLRLGARGYIPHYRWAARVPVGTTLDLGNLELVKGASVSGFIEPPQGSMFASCRAELTSPDGRPIRRPHAETAVSPARGYSAGVNERGFFQLGPIPPGEYRVAVACDKRRRVAAASVTVAEGAESRLSEPIILRSPAALDVTVTPALDPSGSPWSLELWGLTDEVGEDILRAEAGRDGHVLLGDIPEGDYTLDILARDGGRWFGETIRIEPDSGPVRIQLETPLALSGTVAIGSRPLRARLTFEGYRSSVSFESDEEGRFAGFLPRASEKWHVEVQAVQPRVSRRLRDVPVELDMDGKRARVDIHLVDSLLTGVVVDEKGKPVARAAVTVQPAEPGSAETPTSQPADDEGRFELRGLPRGRVRLRALTRDVASEDVEVALAEDPVFVRLIARENPEFTGRVVSAEAGAPIPDARVRARNLGAAARSRVYTSPVDAEGRFKMKGVPPNAGEFVVVAGAPGWSLRVLRVAVAPDRSFTVALERGMGGSILLELPGPWDLLDPNGPSLVLFYQAVPLPLNSLVWDWAPLQGVLPQASRPRSVALPQMPAGEYLACAMTRLQSETVESPPPRGCVRGALAAGGEITLSIAAPVGS